MNEINDVVKNHKGNKIYIVYFNCRPHNYLMQNCYSYHIHKDIVVHKYANLLLNATLTTIYRRNFVLIVFTTSLVLSHKYTFLLYIIGLTTQLHHIAVWYHMRHMYMCDIAVYCTSTPHHTV